MHRLATSLDEPALLDLLTRIGLFGAEEVDYVGSTFESWLVGEPDRERFWLVDDEGGELLGLAYCAPEALTDRSWNLLLVAQHPAHRGGGRGTQLVGAVEAETAARGGRMLIVDTSGKDAFEKTRAFYIGLGFELEGRIRDYYADGDDKVTYRKLLLS